MRKIDERGKVVASGDPSRLIWYSAKCRYWTDDFNKLSVRGGIPCCPQCGCPGFQITASKWDAGIARHAEAEPKYPAELALWRENCQLTGRVLTSFLPKTTPPKPPTVVN